MFRKKEFLEAFESALEKKEYKYLEPMNKSGGWAEIFYVYSKEDKEIRVAKFYKESIGRINESIYKSDAKKLMDINHDNVVKIIDKDIFEFEDNKYFYLILEHIRGKSFEEIDSRLFLELPYNERLNYFTQALEGINEFRQEFNLHRDLHSGNIILSEEYEKPIRKVKIIDPGSSRYYYEPEDEDIDLYSIKEELVNLYLRPEEIKRINEDLDLNSLEFPKFRELIKELHMEEKRKLNFERLDSVIDNDQIDIFIEQFDKERDIIDEEISSIDSGRKHFIFSFATLPINLTPDGFDFNNPKTITAIKNLRDNLMYSNPYSGVYHFYDFVSKFIFQGEWYQADFLRNSDLLFNFSRIKIYKNGSISIIIAVNAYTVEKIKNSYFFIGSDKKLINSLWIRTNLILYLIIMWLKLTRTIYSKLECHGIVKLFLDIYSGWDLSLAGDKQILMGNNINPQSKIDVKISELRDNDEMLNIIQSILKELLRYFNIDIDRFQEGYSLFEKTLERYFDPVFGDKPKSGS